MCPLPEQSPVALLLSGGLDSSILLGHLLDQGHEILPIYIDSGLIWQHDELSSLGRFLTALDHRAVRPLSVLHMPLADVYGDHWSLTGVGVPEADSEDQAVYLPGRGALLLVKAALCCQTHGIEHLAIGVLGSSLFADAKECFVTQFTKAMNIALSARLEVHRPFSGVTKREVMRLGRDLPLGSTFSCVSPHRHQHCGRCNKCAERKAAFGEAELSDPTQYAICVPTTG